MKTTLREKLLVILLLVVLLSWLDYTYVIKGQMASLDAVKLEQVTYVQRFGELKKISALNKSYDDMLLRMENQVDVILDKQFTSTEQEEVILILTDLSENTGITLTGIDFERPIQVIEGDASFNKVSASIDFAGTYDTLTLFLRRIWGFQKDIIIEQIEMSVASGNNISGTMRLGLNYLKVPEQVDYKDNLFKFLTDDSFFKGDPFVVSVGASLFRINYIFTGGKAIGTETYKPFADIKGHWAENEINAFGEQGILLNGQNNNFEPDTPMTRGEFIILIDHIYQWPTPTAPADLSQYSDYNDLGSYENAISKAVVKGLLSGYVVGFQDNTLRPRDPITYSDVEYIFQRLKNDSNFTWDLVAEKLLADKAIVSLGTTDKGGQMTKAEAIYLMTFFK